MTTESIDPRELAAQELADATVPTPEDALEDVGPLARLMWLQRAMYDTMALWTASIAMDGNEALDDGGELVEALQAFTLACGNLDQACVAVGILDPEAIAPPTP